MFTGIVDHCGTISAIERGERAVRFLIQCNFTDIAEGESIAVNGICLTAITPSAGRFFADVSPETLGVTAAGQWETGSVLNLERALRPMDRLGGHWVTGHVDQIARVTARETHGDFVRFLFDGIPEASMRYLLKKGSIAVNGVSLTINGLSSGGFEVMLIPHTLARTSLSGLKPDDSVNIEFDWMVKVVLEQAQRLSLLKEKDGDHGNSLS
jgi:riboflavin synthase